MKNKIIFLAVASVMFLSAGAQDLGRIIIKNASTSYPKFIASLNGVRLSNDYSASTTFNLLDESVYRLKLLQAGSTNVITYTLTSEPKYLSKYLITKDNAGNYSIILESKSLIMDELEPPVNTPTVAVVTPPVTAVTTVAVTNTTAAAPAVTITAISSNEFNDRMNAVKKESFDRDRLDKAKQVFEDEYLTTNQVIEVVKVYSFDDSKLDFAKWAYKHTLDKKNYYKVEDQFAFSASKSSLSDYVRKQPK